MTDSALLRAAIRSSGYKMSYIAEKLGITPQGLYKKIENRSEFKASEILILTKVLGLSSKERESIFFAAR
jgi:DNA-binding phage protein